MRQVIHASLPLFFGLCLIMLGNGLQGTLLGVRATIEGFGTASIGLVMSLYYVGYVIGSFFVPKMVKNVGHIRVFTALASLVSVTALLHGALVDVWFWVAIRLFTGFSYAGLYIVAESWLNDMSTNKTRGKILALYQVISFGGLVGGQFLLSVADPGTITLFILTSVLVSIALIPISLSSRPAPSFDEPEHISLRRLFVLSPFGMVCSFGSGTAVSIVLALGAVYASQLGLSITQISTFMATYLVGGVLFQIPIGWLSDRYKRRSVLIGLCLLGGFVSLGCFFLPITNLLFYVFLFLVGGCSLSIYGQASAHTNDNILPKNYVAAGASLILVNGLGAAFAPFVVSMFMSVFGVQVYFPILASIFFVLSGYGFFRILKREAVPLEEQTDAMTLPVRYTPVIMNMMEEDDSLNDKE